MAHLLKSTDGTSVTGIIGWFLIEQAKDSPRIQAILDTNLNATGRSAFAALTQQCTIDAIIRYGLRKTSAWTKSGESLNAMIARYPVLKRDLGRASCRERVCQYGYISVCARTLTKKNKREYK